MNTSVVAKVTTIYPERGVARVQREDTGIITGELTILKRGDNWTPNVGDLVACLLNSNGSNGLILGEA